MSEFNFVHKNVTKNDVDLFMGPVEPDKDGPFITFDDTWIMAHIMHAAGIFKSVGDARRNGWNKPIPHGFTREIVTKRKIHVFILKLT